MFRCVPIICKECNEEVTTTSLGNFAVGKLYCGCGFKSENRVRVFLRECFGVDNILSGMVEWCKNPKASKKLPYDMIIEGLKIIVEVGRRQHFEIRGSQTFQRSDIERTNGQGQLQGKDGDGSWI